MQPLARNAGFGVDRLRGTLPVYALSNRPMHGEGEMGGRLSLTMHGASISSSGLRRSKGPGEPIRLEIPSTKREAEKIISSSVIIPPQMCANLLCRPSALVGQNELIA